MAKYSVRERSRKAVNTAQGIQPLTPEELRHARAVRTAARFDSEREKARVPIPLDEKKREMLLEWGFSWPDINDFEQLSPHECIFATGKVPDGWWWKLSTSGRYGLRNTLEFIHIDGRVISFSYTQLSDEEWSLDECKLFDKNSAEIL
jgi:hypothetical protein